MAILFLLPPIIANGVQRRPEPVNVVDDVFYQVHVALSLASKKDFDLAGTGLADSGGEVCSFHSRTRAYIGGYPGQLFFHAANNARKRTCAQVFIF